MRSLFVVLIFILSFHLPFADAEPLPEGAEKKLAEILNTKEFQPREHSLNPIEKMVSRVSSYALKKLQKMWESFDSDKYKLAEDSWLVRFFETLRRYWKPIAGLIGTMFQSIWVIGQVTLAVLILYFVWRKALPFLIKKKRGLDAKESGLSYSFEDIPELDDLVKAGKYLEALALIRQSLRSDILSSFSLSTSITDRELSREIKDRHPKSAIFSSASSLFERFVFAGQAVSPELISELYELYERD